MISINKCSKCNNFSKEFLCYTCKNLEIGYKTAENFNVSKPFNVKKSNASMCSACNTGSPPFVCKACFAVNSFSNLEINLKNNKTCIGCLKKTEYLCENCFEKVRTKENHSSLTNGKRLEYPENRRSKSSVRRKVCSVCKSTITPSEERNCKFCKTRVASFPCPKCNKGPSSISHICDNCLKKDKQK